jgi:hypothetical protein
LARSASTTTFTIEGPMRRIAVLCCAAALFGCSKAEKQPAEQAGAAVPRPISLADVAGRWTMKAMNQARDTTLVTYTLNATADTTGWTIQFANRSPIPARVSVHGADVVIDAGPYESVLRRGVQVTTHGLAHLDNGRLVGTTIAHYSVTTADSVRQIVIEGTRQ